MVAIAILAIALVGPFVAVQTALTASYVARDQLVASALAQEGMEYIRSIRDNNFLNGRTWMDGFPTYTCYGVSPAHYCTIDPTLGDIHTSSLAMSSYPSLSSVPFLYVSSTGLYNHQNTGVLTRFKRTVQMRLLNANEVEVTVVVSWTTARQTYSVTVVDNLQNWI